jgi:hypothetical protein
MLCPKRDLSEIKFLLMCRVKQISALAFKPFHGFSLQGLVVTESNAGCSAAAAANAFFRVHINGTLLVKNGVHRADRLGKT